MGASEQGNTVAVHPHLPPPNQNDNGSCAVLTNILEHSQIAIMCQYNRGILPVLLYYPVLQMATKMVANATMKMQMATRLIRLVAICD